MSQGWLEMMLMMLEDDICRACWGTSLPLALRGQAVEQAGRLLLEPDPWGWSGEGGRGAGADPWVVEAAAAAVTEDL